MVRLVKYALFTITILNEQHMVATIKNYNSIQEIADSLVKEIAEAQSAFGDYLRKLDEIRTLAEKTKKSAKP